jgi:hypothetical protein
MDGLRRFSQVFSAALPPATFRNKPVKKASGSLTAWLEQKGHAVVAIPQACGLRSIFEHMALMASTTAAVIFRTRHQDFEIYLGGKASRQWLPETGPAGATLKLRGG